MPGAEEEDKKHLLVFSPCLCDEGILYWNSTGKDGQYAGGGIIRPQKRDTSYEGGICAHETFWYGGVGDEQVNERVELLRERFGTLTDVDRAAAEASKALAAEGGRLDAVLLGMGEDGHICSMFPGSPTLTTLLTPGLKPAVYGVPAGRDGAAPPQERLTLNLPWLVTARCVVLALTGAKKRAVFEREAAGDPAVSPIAALPAVIQVKHQRHDGIAAALRQQLAVNILRIHQARLEKTDDPLQLADASRRFQTRPRSPWTHAGKNEIHQEPPGKDLVVEQMAVGVYG